MGVFWGAGRVGQWATRPGIGGGTKLGNLGGMITPSSASLTQIICFADSLGNLYRNLYKNETLN